MPITPSFSLYNAVHNFHVQTDKRSWQRSTWDAHTAARQARKAGTAMLQGTGDNAAVQDAAAALHQTMWRGVRADFCFAQQLLGYNQLPKHAVPSAAASAGAQAAAPKGWLAGVRACTVGLLLGCAAKTTLFTVAALAFAPLAVLRRSLGWMLHYDLAGVPVVPPSGASVAAAERRLAMFAAFDSAIEHTQTPIDMPERGVLPAGLSTPPAGVRNRMAAQLAASPQLIFADGAPADLARRHVLVSLPALQAVLDPAVLGRSLQREAAHLTVDNRPFDMPAAWLTSAEGPKWHVHFHKEAEPAALQIRCQTHVPAGRYGDAALHLRVPLDVHLSMRLATFAPTTRAQVEQVDLAFHHESNRPLWFPLRPQAAMVGRSAAPAQHAHGSANERPLPPSRPLTPEQPSRPLAEWTSPQPPAADRPMSEKSSRS